MSDILVVFNPIDIVVFKHGNTVLPYKLKVLESNLDLFGCKETKTALKHIIDEVA